MKGVLNPKFDVDHLDIYASLFLSDRSAIANMTSMMLRTFLNLSQMISFTTEIWTNGQTFAWQHVKLKLYTQVKDVDAMYDQAVVDTLLSNADDMLISAWDESFNIPYGKQKQS